MTSMKQKQFPIFVFFLFIGIAVAPSINQSVVQASTDNDLVEVTTQTCGIKGYEDTTVKLTREQYQNLEQYLVEFRARLNQTTTREEAIPIFKEAVVELDKYGLLPRGMSVEKAQKLVIGNHQNNNIINLIRKISGKSLFTNNENFICLLAGFTNFMTTFQGFITSGLVLLNNLMWFLPFGLLIGLIVLLNLINMFFPVSVIQRIGFGGGDSYTGGYSPAYGWIFTLGLLGIKTWHGAMIGDLNLPAIQDLFGYSYAGVCGFTGIKIFLGYAYFYFGTALDVKIAVS